LHTQSTNLHEVIYVSTRAEGISDHEVVDGIVLPSGIKNRRLNITGCLWFSPRRFLQILEGPRKAVEDVYAAILRDQRHRDITTVSSSPITNRSFSRWGMRALQNDKEESIQAIIEEYAPGTQVERNVAQAASDQRSLLEQIRAYLIHLANAEHATK